MAQGYSFSEGQKEKISQTELLKKEVLCLIKKGYFNRVRILLKNKLTDVFWCTCYARASYELAYYEDAYRVLKKALQIAKRSEYKVELFKKSYPYFIFLYTKMLYCKEPIPDQWMKDFQYIAKWLKMNGSPLKAVFSRIKQHSQKLLN